MTYLIDTNVVSEVRKPSGSAKVKTWLASQASVDLFTSVMVIGEIRRGIERLRGRDPRQASILDLWLATMRREFAARILPISTEIAEEWGRLDARRSLPFIDGFLVATAKVHELILVTRSKRDVARTGVLLIDPWMD